MAKSKKFYVVWAGRKEGIFNTWDDCKKQVDKYPGGKYKGYPSLKEAEEAFGSGTIKTSVEPGAKQALNSKKVSSHNAFETLNEAQIGKLNAHTKIFCDGGCNPNPGNSGSGVAIYEDDAVSELWYGLHSPDGTNNSAELNAFHQALLLAEKGLDQGQSVVILSDSQYTLNSVTNWAYGWEKKGWKRKTEGDIKNLSTIKACFTLYNQLKESIQIHHVNAHINIEGNELADRMATLAIDSKETAFVLYKGELNIPLILADD
jgi:ribonuclease HI